MAHGTTERETLDAGRRYLRVATYSLTVLLGVSLLVVGTIAIIAQLKGTWHWMIHLESTISFMSVFVGGLVVVLAPSYAALTVTRWLSDE